MTLSYRKPSALLLLGLILILFLLTVHRYSKRFDKDFTGFACMGDLHPAPGFIPEDAFVLKNSHGYDGQFFYMICHDPWIITPAGQFMDVPAYRYQRILYPLLAKIIALGHSGFYAYTLVAVNILAILGGSFFIFLFIKERGKNTWLTLFYPLFGGLLLCTLRDLAEPLALFFLTAAFYYSEKPKPLLLCLSLSLMLLSRELFLIFIPFFLLDSLWLRRCGKKSLLILLSVIPWLLWEYYIYRQLGVSPFSAGTGNFALPLQGFLKTTLPLFQSPGNLPEKIYRFITLFSILACVPVSAYTLWKKRDLLSFCFAAVTLFPFILSEFVWIEYWSYGRILLPLHLTALLTAIRHQNIFFWIPVIPLPLLFLIIQWHEKILIR